MTSAISDSWVTTIIQRDSHLPLPLYIVSVVFLGFNTVLPWIKCITGASWIQNYMKSHGSNSVLAFLLQNFADCPLSSLLTGRFLKRKECSKQTSSQNQMWQRAFLLPPREASNEGMPWTAEGCGQFRCISQWIPWIWVAIPWAPGRLAGSKVRIWPSVSSFDFLVKSMWNRQKTWKKGCHARFWMNAWPPLSHGLWSFYDLGMVKIPTLKTR